MQRIIKKPNITKEEESISKGFAMTGQIADKGVLPCKSDENNLV